MDTNQIIQKNDSLYKVYGEKYISKIEYLKKVITEEETGQDKFLVLPFEAGLGKSHYTDLIIEKYLDYTWGTRRKFLIVKKFNDESYKSERTIDNPFVQNRVAVITSKSWNEYYRNQHLELVNKQVLIISHQRYINLCLNDKERALFTEGRHTLIIDEKVNFPIYTYTDPYYNDIRKSISYINRELFDMVCNRLNAIIEQYKGDRTIQRVMPAIDDKTLNQFVDMMEGEIFNNQDVQKKRSLYQFLDTVKICFDSSIQKVINSNKIDGLNRGHKHWGLSNNIILDASAGIDGVYDCHTKFQVNKQTPMIDHNESQFIHIKLNSSKYHITQHKDTYFNKIVELIKQQEDIKEKSVLVLHKSLVKDFYTYAQTELGKENIWIDKTSPNDPEYNGQRYAIAWYGNLVGKNWAGQGFERIWLLATPNIPYTNYLIQFMQYSNRPLGKKGLSVDKGKFRNLLFMDIQQGYVAAEMYQALKRIQRNPAPKGKFYIVNNDDKLIKKILSPIKNATITETIEMELEEKEKVTTKQDAVINYMIALINAAEDKQHINKKDVADQFKNGIRWDRVKNHPDIIKLRKSGQLVEQKRYFVVHKKLDSALKRKV